MKHLYFFLVLLVLAGVSCGARKPTSMESSQKPLSEIKCDTILQFNGHSVVKLDEDVDLEGKVAKLPPNITFISGKGVIKNGSLCGNLTNLLGKGPFFENVRIHGKWKVERVSTDMFSNLDYENSLSDVLALTNSSIQNEVYIGPGNYIVSAKSFLGGLYPKSNSHITLDGNIMLLPNEYNGCYVIYIDSCQNVLIDGKGCIIGDKDVHKGHDGQWGHGINIYNSKNIIIKDINVKNCWGDCIYVGLHSEKIMIDNCSLDNGRRQGISVTSASHVKISNCRISNVAGSDPQYAIDIEPNEGDIVDDVLIENVQCIDCVGGITSWRPKNAKIGRVRIFNCLVQGTTAKRSVVLECIDKAEIKGCTVYSGDNYAINATRVKDLKIKDNKIISRNNSPLNVIKCDRKIINNNTVIFGKK